MWHFVGGLILLIVWITFKLIIRFFSFIGESISSYEYNKEKREAIKRTPSFQKKFIMEASLSAIQGLEKDDFSDIVLGDDGSVGLWDGYYKKYDYFKQELKSSFEVEKRLQDAISKSPQFQNALLYNKELKQYYDKHPDGGLSIFVIDDVIYCFINKSFISFDIEGGSTESRYKDIEHLKGDDLLYLHYLYEKNRIDKEIERMKEKRELFNNEK